MKRTFITFVYLALYGLNTHGQLLPLNDDQLEQNHGYMGSHIALERTPHEYTPITQTDSSISGLSRHNLKTSTYIQSHPYSFTSSTSTRNILTGLSKDDLSLTQGIEIDLEIQVSFDMQWQDSDGLNNDGNGQAGELTLSGVHLGNHKGVITAEMLNSERPFLESELALVNNIFIDVDRQKGMFITVEEIGDRLGNGLDIIVNDIYLGREGASAGGILIENLSNFIQDKNLTQFNQTFNMALTTFDDGKNTANGNWLPINAIVLSEEGTASADDAGLGLPIDNLGLPSLNTNTTIDASFALHLDKLAWVDDGGEFGIAGLMIYDGLDTNNDGIDDTVGPARLTQMKLETVNHTAFNGEQVQALHIANLDFKADIAMQSIYVGNPQTGSLGALHIKGLDTAGTSVWIYAH